MRSFPTLISELVLTVWSDSSFMLLLSLLGTTNDKWKVSWKQQKNVWICHQYQYVKCYEYQYQETLQKTQEYLHYKIILKKWDVWLRIITLPVQTPYSGARRSTDAEMCSSPTKYIFHVKLKAYISFPKFQRKLCINFNPTT